MAELKDVPLDAKVRVTLELTGDVLQNNPEFFEIHTGKVRVGVHPGDVTNIEIIDQEDALDPVDRFDLDGVPMSRLRADEDD